MLCASDSIAKLPGCMEWMSSSTASRMVLTIIIRLSMHRHPCFTLISRHYEWIYGLISFNRSSSLRMTHSRTSFKLASFPFKIANNFLLKFLLMLSVNLRSCALSMAPVEGVVSVLDKMFVVVVVEGKLSEKVNRALILWVSICWFRSRLLERALWSNFLNNEYWIHFGQKARYVWVDCIFSWNLVVPRIIWRIFGDYLNWYQIWALLGLIVQIVRILQFMSFAAEMQQVC